MLITDLKRDFYSVLQRKHVLILSSVEVDSVCCSRLLQCLLEHGETTYSLVPVGGTEDMLSAFAEYTADVQYVVLVNCGATIDVLDLLQATGDTVFFIIDNRRPLHLNNVYDSKQVRIVLHSDEELKIPAYETVFAASEDEDAEDASDDDIFGSPVAKQRRGRSRAEKMAWESRRNNLLISYYQFNYYSTPVLSSDSPEMLWWALVGFSSQLVEGQISLSQYTIKATDVSQRQLLKLNRRLGDKSKLSKDCLSISFESDLLLSLYRHWTLYDSIRMSSVTASHFRSWTLKGSQKLNEFLVQAGLPLTECRQKYSMMELDLRNSTKESLESTFEKFNISEVMYGSFVAKYTYSHKLSACDVAEALAGLLFFQSEPGSRENFFSAISSLTKCNVESIYDGMKAFQRFMQIMFKETQRALNDGSIQDYQSALVCHIGQESTGWKFYNNPYGIYAFGRYMQRAFISGPKGKRYKSKPLLITSSLRDVQSSSLVAGIPPLYVQTSDERPVNLFGQAFLHLSERTRCRLRQKFFNSHVIELCTEDMDRFLTALVALLQP